MKVRALKYGFLSNVYRKISSLLSNLGVCVELAQTQLQGVCNSTCICLEYKKSQLSCNIFLNFFFLHLFNYKGIEKRNEKRTHSHFRKKSIYMYAYL